MGNSAMLIVRGERKSALGIYLQWNGGPDSIHNFLTYLNNKVTCSTDSGFAVARLVQIIGNYFGGNTSIDLMPIDPAILAKEPEKYAGDNGIYVLEGTTRGLQVRGRFLSGGWFTHDAIWEEIKTLSVDPEFQVMLTKANEFAFDRKPEPLEKPVFEPVMTNGQQPAGWGNF